MNNKINNANRLAAYEWAAREMKMLFPKPDAIRIQELDNLVIKYDSHVSLFGD